MTDTKFEPGVVNMTTASAPISTENTLLRGVHVQVVLSAQELELSNGSTGATLFRVPASTPAGSWIEAGDMRFPDGIYVKSTGVTSGIITINSRQQPNWSEY